jgi:hypothetical protein
MRPPGMSRRGGVARPRAGAGRPDSRRLGAHAVVDDRLRFGVARVGGFHELAHGAGLHEIGRHAGRDLLRPFSLGRAGRGGGLLLLGRGARAGRGAGDADTQRDRPALASRGVELLLYVAPEGGRILRLGGDGDIAGLLGPEPDLVCDLLLAGGELAPAEACRGDDLRVLAQPCGLALPALRVIGRAARAGRGCLLIGDPGERLEELARRDLVGREPCPLLALLVALFERFLPGRSRAPRLLAGSRLHVRLRSRCRLAPILCLHCAADRDAKSDRRRPPPRAPHAAPPHEVPGGWTRSTGQAAGAVRGPRAARAPAPGEARVEKATLAGGPGQGRATRARRLPPPCAERRTRRACGRPPRSRLRRTRLRGDASRARPGSGAGSRA